MVESQPDTSSGTKSSSEAEVQGIDDTNKFEVGQRVFVHYRECYYEGELMWQRQKDQHFLFKFDKSAIGNLKWDVDISQSLKWFPPQDICAKDQVPDNGSIVYRAKTRKELYEAPEKPKEEFTYTSYSTRGSSYFMDPGRAECGFVGIRNQGATCYLNSLIQSYFMTPRLREAIFRFRYEAIERKEARERCVPYQLQKLFANLQITKQQATQTRGLTDSFGWGNSEVFEQHDVVELATILLSHLEEKSKDENLVSVVKQYKVHTADYVKCLNCTTKNERNDLMIAVQLNIENKRSLEEALEEFIKPEVLDGDNQYRCSKCDSKRDAKKGIRFTKFNDFVAFQLGRWTLDWTTLERKKVRNKVSFPFRINLSKFLADPSEEADDEPFELAPLHEVKFSLQLTGLKDAEPLMDDIIGAVAHSLHQPPDDVTAIISESGADSCALNMLVVCEEHEIEGIEGVLDDLEAFQPVFKREFHLHAEERKVAAPPTCEVVNISKPTHAIQTKEYELYSMMIHRGGAYGGHYFAYIKHPSEFTFYEFNDSTVSEITPQELEDMFNPECPKPSRDSPLSGAYMLLYRRVGSDNTDVPGDLLPDEIRKELEKANADWEEKYAEKKKRDLQIKVKVGFNKKNQLVDLVKTDSVPAAIAKIKKSFKIPEATDDNLFRLRILEGSRPVTPLPTDESTLLEDFQVHQSKMLVLEQRDEGEEFEEYKPRMKEIVLKFVDMEAEEYTIKEEQTISILKRAPIGELRKQVAKILGTEPEKVKLWKKASRASLPEALDDDSKSASVYVAKSVIVETCQDYTKKATYKCYSHFNELSHIVEIQYRLFNGCYQSLTMDNRKTLGEFRQEIGKAIDKEPYAFCIEKEPSHSYQQYWLELRKDSNTLQDYGIINRTQRPTKVKLQNKPALRPGEYHCKLKYQDKDQWKLFVPTPVTVNSKWTYDQAREFFSKLKSKYGTSFPEPEHIRIRKIQGQDSPNKAMDESQTLGDLTLYDNVYLGCQFLEKPERLKRTDRVVSICRWWPQRKKCGPREEIVVDGNMKLKDGSIASFIEEYSGGKIPAEHVRFQKAMDFQINNGLCANFDWELEDLPAGATLVRAPVLLKHGDNIVYKDNREEEINRSSYRSNWKRTNYHREERGLKIFSIDDEESNKKGDAADGAEGGDAMDIASEEEKENNADSAPLPEPSATPAEEEVQSAGADEQVSRAEVPDLSANLNSVD